MILVMGHIDYDAGQRAAVQPALEAVVAGSRAEDGCIAYTLAFDPVVDGRIVVAERWRDRAALDVHGTTAHVQAWRKLIAGAMRSREIDIFEVADDAALRL